MAKYTAPAVRSQPYNAALASKPGEMYMQTMGNLGGNIGKGLGAAIGGYLKKRRADDNLDNMAESIHPYVSEMFPEFAGKDGQANLRKALKSGGMDAILQMEKMKTAQQQAKASMQSAYLDQQTKLQSVQKSNDERFKASLGAIDSTDPAALREFAEDYFSGKSAQELQMNPAAVEWLKQSGAAFEPESALDQPGLQMPEPNQDNMWNSSQVRKSLFNQGEALRQDQQNVLDNKLTDYTGRFLDRKVTESDVEIINGMQVISTIDNLGNKVFVSATPVEQGMPDVVSRFEVGEDGVATFNTYQTTKVGGVDKTTLVSSNRVDIDEVPFSAQPDEDVTGGRVIEAVKEFKGDSYATLNHRVQQQAAFLQKSAETPAQLQEQLQAMQEKAAKDEVDAAKSIETAFTKDPTGLGENADTVAKAILARNLLNDAAVTQNVQLAQAATRYFIRLYEKGILTEADMGSFGSTGLWQSLREKLNKMGNNVDVELMQQLAQAADKTLERVGPEVSERVENLFETTARLYNIPPTRLQQISSYTDLKNIPTIKPLNWKAADPNTAPRIQQAGTKEENEAAAEATTPMVIPN